MMVAEGNNARNVMIFAWLPHTLDTRTCFQDIISNKSQSFGVTLYRSYDDSLASLSLSLFIIPQRQIIFK